MAEFLQVSYGAVCVAAAIPAGAIYLNAVDIFLAMVMLALDRLRWERTSRTSVSAAP